MNGYDPNEDNGDTCFVANCDNDAEILMNIPGQRWYLACETCADQLDDLEDFDDDDY